MRCLTLANALGKRGARVRFVSRQLPPQLRTLVGTLPHEIVMLDAERDSAGEPSGLAHSHWLGASQSADARATGEALAGQAWGWLAVDHYALDARWEGLIKRTGGVRRIIAVDDLADRRHDCEILLDQNLYPDSGTRYAAKVPPHCQTLLGPTYALLREEFAALRPLARPRSGVRHILVMLGGMDLDNHTERVVCGLSDLRERGITADVVIGGGHPASDRVEQLCARIGFSCHVNVFDVAHLMAAADLAIGASGSTSWERCCLALPAVCMTYAENQIPIAEGLAEAGAAVNLGDAASVGVADINNAVRTLIDHPARLRSLSEAAGALVDGKGVDRVCDAMLAAA